MSTADTQTKTVTVTFDRKPLPGVPEHTTPDAILVLGGVDPATNYQIGRAHV